MNMIDFFDRAVRIFRDRTCYIHDDNSNGYSYNEVSDITHRIANGLANEVPNAVNFAVYSPNHSLAFPCILGGQRRGMKWISLNARSGIDEISYILQRCECNILFFHSQFEEYLPRLMQDVPSLQLQISIDKETSYGPELLEWCSEYEFEAPNIQIHDEDICALINTGGTTGKPKAAQISYRSMSTMIAAALTYLQFDTPPLHLVIAPMSHVAGAVGVPLLSLGATNVIATNISPPKILQNIEQWRPSFCFLPPTLIYLLLAEPDVRHIDYSPLKYLFYAAAPMSPDKLEEAINVFGPVLIQAYGQTEVPLWMTCMTPQEHVVALNDPQKKGRLASCGQPTMYGRIEIMDSEGQILGPNETGEIVYRGSLLMSGYYRDPEETELANAHGWHHTGDVGYRADDGYIYIIDRMKDLIISGGFNIYPAEIEKVILSHPNIQDCAVVGAPDDKWGESVTAVLELKNEKTITPQDIIQLCKAKLGSVKAPKTVITWDELPRTSVGKVARREVRNHFWQNKDRNI